VRKALSVVARTLATIVAAAFVIGVGCALIGGLYALIRSRGYVESVAFAMALGGATVCLVVASAGSPSLRAAESRHVVGGRFVEGSDRPQPESPAVLIPASLLVVGIGVLLHIAVV
jgi:hypothetical protein